ncbi:MAG: DUF808 domain-containing protein [Pseudomonadota bacterium]
MSGLLALLDDVAAIAKLAAAQADDVAGQAAKATGKIAGAVLDDAAKAGAKAAGVVIDDAAVTPKYVAGLPAARELPIVWKIARGSIYNKLAILLPAALVLQWLAPWLMTPLLMLGGAYLCFEGAEKIHHLIWPQVDHGPQEAETLSAAHLEERRVKGAIKTDFILSAEIMTIALSAIESDNFFIEAIILAVVAVGITAGVYGAVALLVKADDFGLHLAEEGRTEAGRAFGLKLVAAMPSVMKAIAGIGTAAMLWVGGSIIVHGLHELGWHGLYDAVHHAAEAISHGVAIGSDFFGWLTTAALDGALGLALGFALIPAVEAAGPKLAALFPEKQAAEAPAD